MFSLDRCIINYVREITEPVDTIILGRKLAEGFIPYWDNIAKNQDEPDYEAGVKFSTTQKFVFSKTMNQSIWKNTEVLNGDLVEDINKLKSQDRKDIIVYGGGTFVTSLINAAHIDEFHLFINPSVIVDGMTIFRGLNKKLNLQLKIAKQFDCGIALSCYELKQQK